MAETTLERARAIALAPRRDFQNEPESRCNAGPIGPMWNDLGEVRENGATREKLSTDFGPHTCRGADYHALAQPRSPRAFPLGSAPGGRRGNMSQTRRLAAILAADLAGYSRRSLRVPAWETIEERCHRFCPELRVIDRRMSEAAGQRLKACRRHRCAMACRTIGANWIGFTTSSSKLIASTGAWICSSIGPGS